MITTLRATALLATLIASSVVNAQEQDPGPDKMLYVPTGQETTVTGTIKFTGTIPEEKRIDVSADPVCLAAKPVKSERFVISNERVANVLVYVTNKSILENYSFDAPPSVAVLAHEDCRYAPHVLGVRTRQPLMVVNKDNTQHNTNPTPKSNAGWNQSQAVGGTPIIKSFERSEMPILIRDNQHPWERAYVGVFDHPFFAVSDAEGKFKIEGLPPGTYKVIAWHEVLGEQAVEIVVTPGESRSVDFVFAADSIRVVD